MHSATATTDIVLIGGGHAHVFVLKAFGLRPLPGVRLTLVTKELAAAYSGMLPGFVAGHYALDECQIDLVMLATFAGARIIHGEATAIDRIERCVEVRDKPPIAYDLLSIDVGITPMLDEIEGAREHSLAVKPVSEFAPKWKEFERRAMHGGGPRRIASIGGGAAGVELILAMRHRLCGLSPAAKIDPGAFSFVLIAGAEVLAGHTPRAQRLARVALEQAGTEIIENDPARAVTQKAVALMSGRNLAVDVAIVSTKAAAPGWFDHTDLPRSADGFLATRPTLQLTDDNDIFAVGDCADVIEQLRPKSGVFAVRQGPVVAENLRRRAAGEPLRHYAPQKQYLSLISLGEKRAIASRGPFAMAGAWAWRWKDWIDRRFIDKFSGLPDRRP